MRTFLPIVALVALPELHAFGDPARVDIRTFQFAPDTVHVKVGSKVVWINQDEIEHTVTAGTPADRDNTLNAVLKSKGATAEHSFDRAGTFTVFCDRHQFMRGTITVTR